MIGGPPPDVVMSFSIITAFLVVGIGIWLLAGWLSRHVGWHAVDDWATAPPDTLRIYVYREKSHSWEAYTRDPANDKSYLP